MIISPDGLVLTAAPMSPVTPGLDVWVLMSDGQKLPWQDAGGEYGSRKRMRA